MYLLLGLVLLIHMVQSRPNIVFILADDLGFNDVGFRGLTTIPTPNIDALACAGIILQNYYVAPICTPSRSALMTGKYPIHTGMQHQVLFGAEPRGLPLKERLLPEYLKELGYVTRIVGKWHLGSYKKEYTPTFRGFESHLGYWTGHQDYNDHTAMESGTWGLDMRRNLEVAYDLHGRYTTDVFTDESIRLIARHDISRPLFLYLAHAAVHSGNPYNPLPAPDSEIVKFNQSNMTYTRQRFGGMLSRLDASVGHVIDALRKRKILNDTIIVFSTDNGGPAEGFNLNAASNYPLRGVKNTLWEGGVRGVGFIWSPLLGKGNKFNHNLIHITDWLPTLITAAEGTFKGPIDGVNQWDVLSTDTKPNRHKILLNIDDIWGDSALIQNNWKLVKGSTYNGVWDKWYGPADNHLPYNYNLTLNSRVQKALETIGLGISLEDLVEMRKRAKINCGPIENLVACDPIKAPCLFDIHQDPCEYNNLADKYPDILRDLLGVLSDYNSTAVPPGNRPLDPKGNPKFWNYTWTNFGDYLD